MEHPRARNHEGFFLRMSLGLGPGWVSEEFEDDLGTIETQYRGVTSSFELLLGGTPATGLVMGGAIRGYSVFEPTVERGGAETKTNGTSIGVGGILFFANYYPDPRSGLNLQASLGLGGFNQNVDDEGPDYPDISGMLVGLGAGYDFWVGDEWSIGPTFVLTYGSMRGDDGELTVRESFVSPSLHFSGTYH
jgi:hypothetical protein